MARPASGYCPTRELRSPGRSFRLLPLWLWLVALFIAPQLWVKSILNWSVDLFIYPFWLLVVAMRRQLGTLFSMSVQDKFFYS